MLKAKGRVASGWLDDTMFIVLHRLRIRGMATEDLLSAATGLDRERVAAYIHTLEDFGFARRLTGRAVGVAITSSGMTAHAAIPQSQFRLPVAAESLYREFAALNREFKSVCTAWQMRPNGEPNDHSDPAYDQAVLARLWVVHEAVAIVLGELAEHAEHFEKYVDRFNAAAQRVSAGDRSALLHPLSDSYHDIWMELHEDLRLSLGKSR